METLGETAVDRLLQTFTKDSLMRVRAMRLSWTQGGAQGGGDHVRAELHSIVGAAVGIGMKRVTLLCEQIRDAVIANVGSEVERLLDLLEAVLNALPVTWKAINDAVASAETVLPPSSSSSGDGNGQVIPLRKPGA